ncbi:MAG TPA: peptide deformylase [Candidatus Paceibacterota bacterium]|nr:peptide deformylase [Candidatus Paceibacterota bacterium]
MATLVNQNHPVLHEIAAEVPRDEISSPKIKKVLKDMRTALETYNVKGFNGVAIAAPQIGVPLRIFLVHNTSTDPEDRDTLPTLVAINPVLVKLSKRKHIVGEGCLSVGKDYGAVKRSTHATLRALDENGEEYERGASGLLAQIFQHEVDHLDGILFIDKAEKVWNKEDIEAKKLSEASND